MITFFNSTTILIAVTWQSLIICIIRLPKPSGTCCRSFCGLAHGRRSISSLRTSRLFVLDCIFFGFIGANRDVPSRSSLVEFSLTSRTLFIRWVFISLGCSWIYCLWIFITRVGWTNCLPELQRHHLPLRHLSSSAWNRLLLSFIFWILLLALFYFFSFFSFLLQFYLFISDNSLCFGVECLTLLNKHILADLHMLLKCFFVEFSIASGAFF